MWVGGYSSILSATIAFFATLSYMHHFLKEINCLDQNWHLFLFVSAHFKYPINNKIGKDFIVELFLDNYDLWA